MDKSLLSSLFSNALSHAVPVLALLLLAYVAAGCVHSVQTRPRETPAAKGMTALDRYVAEPDPAFAFEHISTQEREGVTAHLLSMTSQTWRSEAEVDAPAWRHWVTIFKPAHTDSETAMLFITGGALDDDAPAPEGMLAQLAVETRSVVIELRMVPNQPLYFKDEPFEELREQGRYEDEVIAYSWRKYLETDDPTWVVQLPMVKSAVRAMDAATAFLASDAGGGVSIEDFVVSGASKRGWTTWLTAAVDVRVKAIIPIVIDMLNLVPSFRHHWEVYGFWAPTIHDYQDMSLMRPVFDMTDDYARLVDLVDPYAYRERLTLPKFMLNGSQDEFFLPDSAQFYWEGLKGPKHIRYVPNAGHNVGDGTDAFESLTAYYGAILYDVPLPRFTWERTERGIEVHTETPPRGVRLWTATNPDARDFRTVTLEVPWTSVPVEEAGAGQYIARLSAPKKGWRAHFVELRFDNARGLPPFTFTTQIYVLPDARPFSGRQP